MDAEVQQRCVEYLTLCEKGPGMVDIMAEMPKFPERQVYCLIITIREFSEEPCCKRSSVVQLVVAT